MESVILVRMMRIVNNAVLAAVITHPEHHHVFPLILEPILQHDGSKKNDCNIADGVIIKLLKDLDIRFIITAHET